MTRRFLRKQQKSLCQGQGFSKLAMMRLRNLAIGIEISGFSTKKRNWQYSTNLSEKRIRDKRKF